jgi:hypothetical protein
MPTIALPELGASHSVAFGTALKALEEIIEPFSALKSN